MPLRVCQASLIYPETLDLLPEFLAVDVIRTLQAVCSPPKSTEWRYSLQQPGTKFIVIRLHLRLLRRHSIPPLHCLTLSGRTEKRDAGNHLSVCSYKEIEPCIELVCRCRQVLFLLHMHASALVEMFAVAVTNRDFLVFHTPCRLI